MREEDSNAEMRSGTLSGVLKRERMRCRSYRIGGEGRTDIFDQSNDSM